MVPRLVVTEGVDEGKQFELLEQLVTIGREPGSTFRLMDTDIARRHAELRALGSAPGYTITDVSGGRGILVNGRPVTTAELKSGDQIQIGKTIFSYGGVLSDSSQPLPRTLPVVTRTGDDLPSAIIRSMPATSSTLSDANLSVLYDAIHAASSILDRDELSAKILELLFRIVRADRGCVLLRDPDDASLMPRAVRFRDGQCSREAIAVSQTIVDYVLRENAGVLVTDAGQDARFRAGASVVRLGIREAICVPLSGRHETLGVLYLDTLRPGSGRQGVCFTENELSLAIAVARQAAIAIEDTRHFQARVQAERLAAIGQAMAAISHHVKNILQGLQSGTDVIKLGIAEQDFSLLSSGWVLLEKNQKRVQELVLDMLTYSKDRMPALEHCSIANIAGDVVALLKGKAAEQKVHLEFHADSVPDMLVEPEAIHRAVLNLVGNAFDATKSTISVRVFSEPNESCVNISVRDDGSGIEPDQLPKLFQPFASSKGARGTGLGLAISRKIAREHGGDILVKNEPGRGCEFTLRIPIRTAA